MEALCKSLSAKADSVLNAIYSSRSQWYCLTKGRVFLSFFSFCWSVNFLSSNFTSERTLFTGVSGQPLTCWRDLNCLIFSSKLVSEELFRATLFPKVSHLTLAPGGGKMRDPGNEVEFKKILMSKWHLIQNQPLLREIYKEPPVISYKRVKSLKDILVQSKL